MPVNVLPSDTFVHAAFAELLADVTNLLEAAEVQKPRDKEEIAFWTRQVNAFNKAEYQWGKGVRPLPSDGAWLIPSASQPGALIHRAVRLGGVWTCNCDGRHAFHWHMALIATLERASELEDLAIDALADRAAAADILADAAEMRAELAGDEPPRRPLGARLAEARMRYAA